MKKQPPINFYEKEGESSGLLVCGVDEVGRGCLAGPVVAAAVILRTSRRRQGIVDSKTLDAAGLQKGYDWIIKNGWYGVGIVHPRIIDEINIYQANIEAMKRAVMQLVAHVGKRPDTILVDAVPLVVPVPARIIPMVRGEQRSISIAAASIVAKVTRDRLMASLARVLPRYQLARHKGYGTVAHQSALREVGASWMHRRDFVDSIQPVLHGDLLLQESII